MQIRTRLTLQFTLLVTAIILLSFYLIYFFTERTAAREFQNRLRGRAITAAILKIKVDQVDSALMKIIDRAKQDNLHSENISLYDSAGKEIYTNNDTIHFNATPHLLNEIRARGEIFYRDNNLDVIGFLFPVPDKETDYVVIAGAIDLEGIERLSRLKALLTFLFFGMIAIVATSGWIYAGRALRPIKKIMNQMQSISTKDLSRRLADSDRPDEIGRLAGIFNSLLARIENAFNLQKTFVANVSHELKNPLTKITSQLEVILLKERNHTEYKETIQSVLEDIKELNQLSTSLLDLASLNQDAQTFTMSRLRLDEILWEVRDATLLIDPHFTVDLTLPQMPEDANQLYVTGNPYLLKTAFQNLVENACKFSEDNKCVVSLLCSNGILQVRVQDNGPGIQKKDLQNVFQPFFRTDNTSRVKGYGIGLPLTEKIVAIHKGTIEIDSTPGESTIVTVTFKRQIANQK